MTWTYGLSSLDTTPKDQVRFLVGDTLREDPQLQDEEISYLLGIESGPYFAAARACEAIAALYARKVTTTVGDLKIVAEKKYEHYLQLANNLRMRAGISDCAPQAGGISVADKQAQESDTDRVQPFFTRNDARNPNAQNPYPPRTQQYWGTR